MEIRYACARAWRSATAVAVGASISDRTPSWVSCCQPSKTAAVIRSLRNGPLADIVTALEVAVRESLDPAPDAVLVGGAEH
ncbi:MULTISPECIES: hypothetical protein [unclassified Curtobacterium]|uniref:hypothetical protein n=1 Tax=unclassified Curtobacterium TaxID=257496 RepID=UPI00226B51BC|nr:MULTISPECIES: hypothetical protein [unclassified Curtobacterium]